MMNKSSSRTAHPADEAAVKAYDSLNKLWRKFIKTQDPNSDYAHSFLPMTPGMRMLPMYNPEVQTCHIFDRDLTLTCPQSTPNRA